MYAVRSADPPTKQISRLKATPGIPGEVLAPRSRPRPSLSTIHTSVVTPPRPHAHNTRARARATHSTTRSKHANPLPHTQFGAHTDKGFHTTVRPVPRLSQLNACSHVPQALALTHTPTALVKRKSSNTKTRDAFTYAVILMPTVDALLWGRVF